MRTKLDGDLPMWVIYESPSDYPGEYVVREFRVTAKGERLAKKDPSAIEKSLYEARMKGIPKWAQLIQKRDPIDPCIIEVWV